MEIIDIKNESPKKSTALALGNFDGLHRGHMALINKSISLATDNKLSGVLLFKSHTRNKEENSFLMSLDDKLEILSSLGLDLALLVDFDDKFKHLGPQDFIKKILIDKCLAKDLVVGNDYHFAYKAQGNSKALIDYGKTYGFKTHLVEDVIVDEKLVSSTLIKEYLLEGNLEKANEALGRNYSIKGKVIKGFGRGKDLGYPTANLDLSYSYLIPSDGVYHTLVKYEGKIYNSMTSIGTNPTFDKIKGSTIEVFIDEFDRDIYDQELELIFLRYLRPMIKFKSLEELIGQLDKDYRSIKSHY